MTKTGIRSLLVALVAVAGIVAMPTASLADSGKAGTTLSFFSGGAGGHADWLATTDQPPGDTDNQAIRLVTTNGAPTYAQGYAGILFHHVTGIPAAAFPDSSFWVKTPYFDGPSLGSPRLVVAFQNAAGQFDGYGDLRPLALTSTWQEVSDVDNYPSTGWDVMGGPCVFRYNVTWSDVQSCFVGDTTLAVYLTTDAYGIYHLIDDITVNGKTFSGASDNGNGNNDPAGPTATTDPSLLPPLFLLPSP
ncbi:MAG TPA: hypothetical protein VIM33_09765 [Gaiellaceae bacterium]|jgi:hypothetical protein